MRKDFFGAVETLGCWDDNTNSIVISRKVLNNIADFSGTLIHELVHADTGHEDVTRDFETSLTTVIGRLSSTIIGQKVLSISNLNAKKNSSWLQKIFGE